MVGVEGFEPTTPCSQSRCATRLRYTPNAFTNFQRLGLPDVELIDRAGARTVRFSDPFRQIEPATLRKRSKNQPHSLTLLAMSSAPDRQAPRNRK